MANKIEEALKRFRDEFTARGLMTDTGRTDVQLLLMAEELLETVKRQQNQINSLKRQAAKQAKK
ncbi:MAG: hypothetical protein QW175_06970 [Candidatus Bathyarchaeia archaeon]